MIKTTMLLIMLLVPESLSFDIRFNHSLLEDFVQHNTTMNLSSETTAYKPYNKTESSRWQFFTWVDVFNRNDNVTMLEWDFFSHLTITSGQCDHIATMVQLLNDALKRANPDVENITSTASRIGNSICVENICPCKKPSDRKTRAMISRRLLEVKTRSSSPDLKPAVQFPLHVTSFHRKSQVHID
jgi:hypothetical protein